MAIHLVTAELAHQVLRRPLAQRAPPALSATASPMPGSVFAELASAFAASLSSVRSASREPSQSCI
ncbi:MAG: hypothetical protein R3E42_15990 [Burkholderiaceae bacterium]